MAGNFDPYLTWLDIPANEQPPHHYRLLGVPAYETNAMVISLAADRQISFLESVHDEEHGFLAEQLIKSIDAARSCLLDPQRKANYDAKLKAKTPSGASATATAQRASSIPVEATSKPAAARPNPAPSRAAAPATAPWPKPASDSSDSSGGDDALSFLSGPGRPRQTAVAATGASRPRTVSVAPQGRSTNPRTAGKGDAAQDKKQSSSRMVAIFVPTIITLVIAIVIVCIMIITGDDSKTTKTTPSANKAKKQDGAFDFNAEFNKAGIQSGKSTPAKK